MTRLGLKTRSFDRKFFVLAEEVIPDEIYTEKLCEDLAGALQQAFDEWLFDNDPDAQKMAKEIKW